LSGPVGAPAAPARTSDSSAAATAAGTRRGGRSGGVVLAVEEQRASRPAWEFATMAVRIASGFVRFIY
jgi:hypothetical protein